MEKIFVVIPNWNGADLITECLKSIEKQTLRAKIVVVDNGSVDESVSIIESGFPNAHLIKLAKNTGFAGGVNTGIRYALEQGADAVALFNNDAMANKNWLECLVKTMETQPKIGIVSCKQLRTDKKHIDSTGDFYSIWGMPFPRGRNHADAGQYDDKTTIFSAPAGATLYRVSMLDEIGLFDEAFFAYYEDVDISFRAQLAGWEIVYEPKAVVYHHVNTTSSKLGNFSRYHTTKNFHLTYLKNMPGWLFWKYLPLFVLQSFRLFAGSVVRGYFVTFVHGFWGAFRLIPYALKQRRIIQKSRKTTLGYIDSMLYKHRPPRIPDF